MLSRVIAAGSAPARSWPGRKIGQGGITLPVILALILARSTAIHAEAADSFGERARTS
jgi:hypothetical protein